MVAEYYLAGEWICDAALLYLTGRMLNVKIGRGRLALSAALGSIYALCALLFPPLSGIFGRLLCAAAMAITAFGGRRAFARALMLLAVTCALGGIGQTLALSGLWQCLVLFALGVPALSRLASKYRDIRLIQSRVLRARFTIGGDTLEAEGLLDTGCTLREPISLLPVVVLGRDLLPERLPKPRIVPVVTVNGCKWRPAWPAALQIMGDAGWGEAHQVYCTAVPDASIDAQAIISPAAIDAKEA